ncbi:MAG: XrtA-associated tyrosine autokinase [Burkholderiales bacterium]|nr:XrtA-associated tyrosine autokinase [Burkholderiales bacterium]
MSTIEQAAKRLEELRRAGVDISAMQGGSQPIAETPATRTEQTSAPSPDPSSDRRSKPVTLDLVTMGRAGLLIPGAPRSKVEDEFRIIKRPLLENAKGLSAAPIHRANLIMVTSAVPDEGKTFCAINLALSMAMEMDHSVLLIEADVLRPSVLAQMGLAPSKGLLDVLSTPGMDLAEVLLKTDIPKLTVLPAGTASSRSTELLASAAMDSLLDELASNYSDRIIIFDTPPLLPTTESRVLATKMGQVVMVVESGQTTLDTVRQAFATVEVCPVVMSILNKYRGPKGASAYGYYAA